MSDDKRSVATDALATLGSIISEAEKRDAIHLAVEPAVATHSLRPGDHVGFTDGGFGYCTNPVGIVDPFLNQGVRTGQRFWLIVYPRQIKSLRHVWEHPAFPNESVAVHPKMVDNSPSRRALEIVASNTGHTYNDLLNHMRGVAAGQDRLYSNNGDNYVASEDLWNHYEAITGDKVSDKIKNEETWFSCSC